MFYRTITKRITLGHFFDALNNPAVNKGCPLVIIDDGVPQTPYPDGVVVGNVIKIVFSYYNCMFIVTAVLRVKAYDAQTPVMYNM